MQIQKVNSKQNFEGGLVKLSPRHFIDVDAIKFLKHTEDIIDIGVTHSEEAISTPIFSANPQAKIKKIFSNFQRAKQRLAGPSHRVMRTGTPEKLEEIGNVDMISEIILDARDNRLFIRLNDGSGNFVPTLTEDHARKTFESLIPFLHKLKSPRGNAIVDLFG